MFGALLGSNSLARFYSNKYIHLSVIRNVYLLVRVVGTPTLSKPSRGCQRICLIPTLHIAVVNGKHNGQTEFFL